MATFSGSQQLAENGLNPVEWGGEIEVVRVSA